MPLSTYTGKALRIFTVITPSCSNDDTLSYLLTEISAFFRISSVSEVIVLTVMDFPSTFITAVLLRAATENADVRNITLIKSITIPLIKTALVLFSPAVLIINIISVNSCHFYFIATYPMLALYQYFKICQTKINGVFYV